MASPMASSPNSASGEEDPELGARLPQHDKTRRSLSSLSTEAPSPSPASAAPTLLEAAAGHGTPAGSVSKQQRGAEGGGKDSGEGAAPQDHKSVHFGQTLRCTWRVASVFFGSSKTRCKAWALVVSLSLVLMLETAMAAWFAKQFFVVTNTLVAMDADGFYDALVVIGVGCAVYLPLVCLQETLQGILAIEWRRCVTRKLLSRYIDSNQVYYRMKSPGCEVDNPDQRIGQDVGEFTLSMVKLLSTVVGSSMKVFIMSGILIAISTDLFLYMSTGSFVFTVVFLKLFGGHLMRLTRLVLAQEATFRFALIRIREHAESIAFYQGAPYELTRCVQIFTKLMHTHYRRLAVFIVFTGSQKSIMTCAHFMPTLILGPRILRGELSVGAIAQANMLFGIVLGSLTALVADLTTIASLGAQSVRIEQLRRTFLDMQVKRDDASCDVHSGSISLTELPDHGDHQVAPAENCEADGKLCLQLDCVTLMPPLCSTPLVSGLTCTLHSGESLLLCGESGIGKSSLLRAIGGLWACGKGAITRCAAQRSFFLPQQPYLCLGTLRDNVEYPRAPAKSEIAKLDGTLAIAEALEAVGLGYLVTRHGLDAEVDFENVLSGGEKQRMGFARLALQDGLQFAMLDESTSALDAKNEEMAYQLLAQKTQCYISVGHRAVLTKFHTHKMLLERQPSGVCEGTLIRIGAA